MADRGTDIVVETERLILRRERPGDLEVWLEHMNTPEVMEKVGGVQPRENVVESFARIAAGTEGELAFYFVALKSDGTLIGKCGLARIETALAPEALRGQVQVGWTLRADHWGHGYATEAAQAMLPVGFMRCGLTTIFAQTSERNRGSWRVMERLGMTRLANLDYDDPEYPPEDNPTMVWGLERGAWQAARAESVAHA
jgi:RimJ/RimL family protein N-acetyltransferase